ncbi:Protein GLUTAMINE DUMPER 3 [Sarracenia purpurea var. burkii]
MAATTTKATFSPAAAGERSPWSSPEPYLFGGLAAMLGLIALALLILACSYRKLSGHPLMEDGEGGESRDVEGGEDKSRCSRQALPAFEEKILVIMAGDVKPTFLATPMSSEVSSFGDAGGKEEKRGEKNRGSQKSHENPENQAQNQ